MFKFIKSVTVDAVVDLAKMAAIIGGMLVALAVFIVTGKQIVK